MLLKTYRDCGANFDFGIGEASLLGGDYEFRVTASRFILQMSCHVCIFLMTLKTLL